MREKKIFDVLENAEHASMERLIDKCPEITDEQLDKIYVMSEKKFKKIKKAQERTMKDKNIEMTENDSVGGVERSRRPSWLTPLSTAASVVLVAGAIIGSTILIRGNKVSPDGDVRIPPAVSATTTRITATTAVSTEMNVYTDKSSTTFTTTEAVTISAEGSDKNEKTTENTTADETDNDFIKPYVGQWRYQTSPNNTVHIDGHDAGTVEIRGDATYTYTDRNGYVTTGSIRKADEQIGGSEVFGIEFSGDNFVSEDSNVFHRAYYSDSMPDEFHFGNGDAARIVRGTENKTYAEIAVEKMDDFDIIEGTMAIEFFTNNDYAFSKDGIDYYRVTRSDKFNSLADIKSLINDTLTGDLKDEYMEACDGRYMEKDGVLYESRGQRGTFSYDTSGGVVLSGVSENQFTATAVKPNFVAAQGRGTAVFTKVNGIWKISRYDCGEPLG